METSSSADAGESFVWVVQAFINIPLACPALLRVREPLRDLKVLETLVFTFFRVVLALREILDVFDPSEES